MFLQLQQRQQEEGQANKPPRPRLCETKIQRMFLPMFPLPMLPKAKVKFAVMTSEGKTRFFSCKTSNVPVPIVLGWATSESKLEHFLHHLVVFDENTTILPRFNPSRPNGQGDNAPDSLGGRRQSRLQGTDEVNVYEYTAVNTDSAPTYIRRRHSWYLSNKDIDLIGCLILVPMMPSIFVSGRFLEGFIYEFFCTYPVAVFWVTLVVWATIFLCDIAAHRSRRCSLCTLAGLVCRALLCGGVFGLFNSSPLDASFIFASMCGLILVPMVYYGIMFCVVDSCFAVSSWTLLLTVDPVDMSFLIYPKEEL